MNIKINGKKVTTNCLKLHDLRKNSYGNQENIITIFNGFQTFDDYELSENDEVNFIEKGKMPPKDEFESLMCARHTPHVFEKVKAAKVAIAGLGGLGSNIAVSLARTGVGHLHLIDFDIVEPSNLNRQQYKIKHLGLYKTEALKNEIEEINPFIEVTIDTIQVTEENIQSLFEGDDIICEAFDNPQAKALLVNNIIECYPQKKIVSASGMAGYESSNTIVTKKITDNFYLCGDRETGAMVGRGLMAPRVSICAGHQSNMILRLILGIEEV
ncbi:sulfur carrier protein ThiS adenylyltransferase [Clostridium saccharoperbutylacetonicum]|uniref:Thiamine biosynthesis protein ThiF n=1 Tax=Clostridium saccharoperbutylacetonicum N1-4(HMT) TaxID=931276 RepID=M1LZE0_9CLOT|nr:sulfur carrier protein ThiS adenylyltransferase ThiF [Clostridium saccharoperbutylacetonicum]AGF58655.1 thiamine biosynthesis protein ThiF [Clostridium saccharoperbutylacetonicum N1-4(HMT)]NRT60566.1 sulfur carrier protein ThiS adenylyltransferase [Clostridium saccharoperbutylacetonicum]NSB23880.1 sulfur carrier protein ThiS adenylyltransferase [Clostridium saccharoperbutylacetonicum]NSB43256.1 sulfur carrier protein ThiS adenylyltransferase [Clostridium saccharoperbutylacetonicum]